MITGIGKGFLSSCSMNSGQAPGSVMALAGNTGIYISWDFGDSWNFFQPLAGQRLGVWVSPDGSKIGVSAANSWGVYTEDRGATWKPTKSYYGSSVAVSDTGDMVTGWYNGLRITANHNYNLMTYFPDFDDIFWEEDGDYQCKRVKVSMDGSVMFIMVRNSTDELDIYSGIYRSLDYGNTWTYFTSDGEYADMDLSSDGNTLVITNEDDGTSNSIHLSAKTSTARSTLFTTGDAVGVAIADTGRVYVYQQNSTSVSVSNDFGVTSAGVVTVPNRHYSGEWHVTHDGTVVIAVRSGIDFNISKDSGQSFQSLPYAANFGGMAMGSFAINRGVTEY